jgi:putative tryptophan/tyrosine transport system substrate-binding protein
MRRRDFIALFGGAAAASAWPLSGHAQQTTVPLIGFLHAGSPDPYAHAMATFRQGLSEGGFVEGKNLTIEYRWAESQIDRLPALAVELVHRDVTIIAVAGGPAAVRAAKSATATIPIVFSLGSDPVKLGFVASLNRPGANVTGVTFLANELEAKQLELISELVPKVSAIGVLVNPSNPNVEAAIKGVREAARVVGRQVHVLNATNERDLEMAFKTIAEYRLGALMISADVLFTNQSRQLAALALRYAVPAIYQFREFAAAGGLAVYGVDLDDIYRKHGTYVGRVLKGEKPADLPIEQPTKFQTVINLTTAKVLGVEVPPALLATADEVIE